MLYTLNNSSEKIDFVHLPDPGKILDIQPLDYDNPYDYKKLHRHDYFEIIFVSKGKGEQLIDFTRHKMGKYDIFIIYPGQVHLMDRQNTQGLVVQFRKNAFEYIHPLKHHYFYNQNAKLVCTQPLYEHLFDLTERIKTLYHEQTKVAPITRQKAFSYLQIILISLMEMQHQTPHGTNEQMILSQYIALITDNIREVKKVAEYAQMMNCSADKINQICKKGIGKTALEIIHEELLLEIRRLLLLNEMSLKEIAFALNFDTPGNFTAFVKSKTGLTPGQLQESVLEIYN